MQVRKGALLWLRGWKGFLQATVVFCVIGLVYFEWATLWLSQAQRSLRKEVHFQKESSGDVKEAVRNAVTAKVTAQVTTKLTAKVTAKVNEKENLVTQFSFPS